MLLKDVPTLQWFNELGLSRQELPFELSQVLGADDPDALRIAVKNASDNIDRALDFAEIANSENLDVDEICADILVKLDICSYYAAMSIPFARQILEGHGGLLNKSIPQDGHPDNVPCDEIFWLNIRQIKGEGERQFFATAVRLAIGCKRLRDQIQKLNSSETFACWIRNYLNLSSAMLVIATQRPWFFQSRDLD